MLDLKDGGGSGGKICGSQMMATKSHLFLRRQEISQKLFKEYFEENQRGWKSVVCYCSTAFWCQVKANQSDEKNYPDDSD